MQRSLALLVIALCLIVPAFTDECQIHTIHSGYPVSFSSVADEKGCNYPRLDAKEKGWCPETNGTHQWLQVSSIKPQLWTGVITQGASHGDAWLNEYMVSSTLDGKEWTYVDNGRIFMGNIDRDTKVKNLFDKPVIARSLKIHPLKWHLHIHFHIHLFRVEFLMKHLF